LAAQQLLEAFPKCSVQWIDCASTCRLCSFEPPSNVFQVLELKILASSEVLRKDANEPSTAVDMVEDVGKDEAARLGVPSAEVGTEMAVVEEACNNSKKVMS